jgi:light-regulated signal transduction histidine kinase (bacteriophytochrome)
LEQFTYAVGHDLQEPLRTVSVYTQLLTLRMKDHLDSETSQFADFVSQGSARMSGMIQDLLAYGQVGTEAPKVAGAGDSGRAVEEAINSLRASIMDAQATVISDPLPWLAVASPQLVQLFQNLIGNALKYRSPDRAPIIQISAEQGEGEWVISVSDNGIGFDLRYAQRIFGVFKRLHGSEYAGTGIGLAICQRIVEVHKGRIWAIGKEGVGATFFVALPAAAPPAVTVA